MNNFQPIEYISPTQTVSADTFFRPVRANFVALSSTVSGSGASMVGVSATPSNYTPTDNSVEGNLKGIDNKFYNISAETVSVTGTPTNYTKVTNSVQGHFEGIDNKLANQVSVKSGITTYDLSTASGTQNIAHGMGGIPSFTRIRAIVNNSNQSAYIANSEGSYDRLSNKCVYEVANGDAHSSNYSAYIIWIEITSGGQNTQQASATLDATNIILTWTKTNNPSGTLMIYWETFK